LDVTDVFDLNKNNKWSG